MKVTFARNCRRTGEQLQIALADAESDFILNWGVGNSQLSGPWINDPTLVAKWGNKSEALRAMFEAGVSVPTPMTLEYALDVVGTDFPVVVRPSSGTRQGRKFFVCTSPTRLRNRAQRMNEPRFAPFIETTSEYRVHIIDGRAVKIQKKVRNTSEFLHQDSAEFPVRTHRNGWIFQYPGTDEGERSHLRQAGKAAVAALELQIGSVDIGWTPTGQPVVFEVNSASGLWSDGSENTTFQKYVRWIKEIWT